MLEMVGDWASYLKKSGQRGNPPRTHRPAAGEAKFLKRAERITGRDLTPAKTGPKSKSKRRKTGRGKARE